MRAVAQRVREASVTVIEGANRQTASQIAAGLLILVGVKTDDTDSDARALAEKVANLRIFEDAKGKMNRSLLETGREALVVSNFTLYGDCRKGRRPSFTEAASGSHAETLYLAFGNRLESAGVPTRYGVFGAQMEIVLINDGPVTLLLDSRREF